MCVGPARKANVVAALTSEEEWQAAIYLTALGVGSPWKVALDSLMYGTKLEKDCPQHKLSEEECFTQPDWPYPPISDPMAWIRYTALARGNDEQWFKLRASCQRSTNDNGARNEGFPKPQKCQPQGLPWPWGTDTTHLDHLVVKRTGKDNA